MRWFSERLGQPAGGTVDFAGEFSVTDAVRPYYEHPPIIEWGVSRRLRAVSGRTTGAARRPARRSHADPTAEPRARPRLSPATNANETGRAGTGRARCPAPLVFGNGPAAWTPSPGRQDRRAAVSGSRPPGPCPLGPRSLAAAWGFQASGRPFYQPRSPKRLRRPPGAGHPPQGAISTLATR